jgi:ribosomal protein S10
MSQTLGILGFDKKHIDKISKKIEKIVKKGQEGVEGEIKFRKLISVEGEFYVSFSFVTL